MFIELTLTDGRHALFNVAQIVLIAPLDGPDSARAAVSTVNAEAESWWVRETVEAVVEKIREARS